MSNGKLIAFLAAAGVAGGAWWAFHSSPPDVEPTPVPPAPAPKEEEPPAPVPVIAEWKPQPAEKTPEDRRLRMPDGSFVPTLNGVVHPAAIVWGDLPYSPIVSIQKDPTVDWYVHADGTKTTTMMQWRSDLGREDAVTLCLHPTAPAPVEPGPEADGKKR
jgi:hypothetical protein